MKRWLMPIVVVGLLLGTVLTVNSVAWSFEKRSLSRIPADQIVLVKPPVAAGEKDYCELEYTNWITGFYFADWRPGDKNAIYFDPEDCGFQGTYPFQLTDVHLVLYDHAEVESVDVRFSVEVVSPDICDGPGIEIWKSEVYTIKTFYPTPKTIIFPDTVCLDRPFFFNVEYISDYPEGEMPSLMFDTDTLNIDTCYQWFWYEEPTWNWHEWYDAWTSIPGWVILRISGHCGEEQTDCGDLWYWKPDTLPQAPSGMPDFDQNQDQWDAYCGPAAAANCLWWFDAVPVGWSPPQLIDTLARYFNVSPLGCTPDDIQTGLVQYFHDYDFNHLQVDTFWMPDFYEMEDSLKRSQDIILLLGFWYYDEQAEEWSRHGGHFVTTAGVYSEFLQIAICDPNQDAAESGWPGRVRPQDHQPHPGDPLVHNNPSFVCHDMYQSILDNPFPSPGNPFWEIDYQWSKGQYSGQNVPEKFRSVTKPVPRDGKGIFATEVEYAVMICPKEITPPGFTVGVLQNPVFSAELNIYSIASESLKTAPTITISSDTLPVGEIRFGETTIYWSNYRLTASGEIEIKVVGTDLANNEGSHTETFSAGSILPSGGNVVSHDNLLRLEVPSGAVEKDEYFLIFKTDDRAGTNDKLQSYLGTQQLLLPSVSWDGAGADIISPAYSITPSRFKLRSRAKLSFDYTGFDLEGRDPSRLTVYLLEGKVWTPVPTYLDSDQRRVVAFVDQLGLYQLRYAKVQDQSLAPTTYALRNNYPNPFNNATTIRYEISSPGWVKIDIYNTLGQRVRTLVNEHVPTGRYIVDWDGTNERDQSVSSGIYFYTLKVNDFTETKKMLFLK